jgi:hypothetical protein
MGRPPKVNSQGELELEKAKEQIDAFSEQIQSLNLDVLQSAKKEEVEPQTKLSQAELARKKAIYLKPARSVSSPEKFNEGFREEYNFAKEYVHFIAENKEIIGETIELWTKPYAGIPAEFWQVPTNKPVWGPRYLAERIRGCQYRVLKMDESPAESNTSGHDAIATYKGVITVDRQVSRLTAEPVIERKSVFIGASDFK